MASTWRILLYARADGTSSQGPHLRCRRIIGGEGNGPMSADSHPAGLVIAGGNPAAVDWVAARLMGFDPDRLSIVREAFAPADLALARFAPAAIDLAVSTDLSALLPSALHSPAPAPLPAFRPHFAWVGAIEWSGPRRPLTRGHVRSSIRRRRPRHVAHHGEELPGRRARQAVDLLDHDRDIGAEAFTGVGLDRSAVLVPEAGLGHHPEPHGQIGFLHDLSRCHVGEPSVIR
jgi:hypothetical protein